MTAQPAGGARLRVHLPGLNALRFLAALIVVVGHTGDGLRLYGFPQFDFFDRFNAGTAGLAVLFFFVLSGFLITYLLLVERSETGTIAVGSFYVRRILRIWPLYYLTVVVAFFVMPHNPVGLPASATDEYAWRNLLLYLTIFPNFATPVWYAGHLWSIGVEEQFYVTWPLLMVLVPRSFGLIVGVIFAYLIGLLAVGPLAASLTSRENAAFLTAVYVGSRFDAMAIGAAGGWLFFRRAEVALRVVQSRLFQTIVIGAVLLVYFRVLKPPHFTYEVYAFLFMLLILDVASNSRSPWRSESAALERLGRISYGMYMYHPLVATTVIITLGHAMATRGAGFAACAYLGAIAATIAVAALSYRFVERPFLRQKLRASTLVTGDLVAEPLKEGSSADR